MPGGRPAADAATTVARPAAGPGGPRPGAVGDHAVDTDWPPGPVERAPVVGHDRRVGRQVPLERIEERGLVRLVRQQQLPDDQLVSLPAAERDQERQGAGGGAQARRLGVQAHDGPPRVDLLGQVSEGTSSMACGSALHHDHVAMGRREDRPPERPCQVGRATRASVATTTRRGRHPGRCQGVGRDGPAVTQSIEAMGEHDTVTEGHAPRVGRPVCQLGCHAARRIPHSWRNNRVEAARASGPLAPVSGPTHAGQPARQSQPSTSPRATSMSSLVRSNSRVDRPTPPGTSPTGI